MTDLELFPKLPKLPYTHQCMVRMVPHPRGASTGIQAILPSRIHGPLDAIPDLYPHHAIAVYQSVLDCVDHADPCSVSHASSAQGGNSAKAE